ncbi:TylF/MycF/NovP-related O-methyltransferase [Streptomyces sp. NPDC050287]|uniref:TylF/MycF/NovP-related O-methyltransferase n=1 Tax=Streptomyces sp. NPDC050287 TaxID=3365608 RepID=UPI00379C2207
MSNASVMSAAETGATAEWAPLRRKCNLPSRDLVLELAVRLSLPVRGDVVEFGVYQGDSTRTIRRVLDQYTPRILNPFVPRKRVYACDSFEGLTDKYERLGVGHFACKPPRIPGVEIVKGYFEDSLTEELARRVRCVSFAHLDADLYGSTLCALNWLTPLLRTGSVLLFDEFVGEDFSEQRAFEDWLKQSGVRTVLVGEFLRSPSGEGDRIDKRMLYQVIRDEDLSLDRIRHFNELRPSHLTNRVVRKLRRLSA